MSARCSFLFEIPRRSLIIAALALIPPAALYLFLQHHPSIDPVLGSHTWHFFIVSAVAAVATVLALAVIRAARGLPDARTFFLAMAFISMAGIFLAHGLGTSPFFGGHIHAAGAAPAASATLPAAATPPADTGSADTATDAGHAGHLAHEGHGVAQQGPSPEVVRIGLVGFSAQLSLILSSVFFALSVLNPGKRLANLVVRHWERIALLAIGAIAIYGTLAVAFPLTLAWIPVSSSPLNWTAAEISWICFAFAGWRFLQSYRLSFLPLQGMMALSMAFLVEAEWFMIEGSAWHLSWWEYHFAMLAGFLGAVLGLLWQYRTTGDLGAVVEGLFLREAVTGMREGDSNALRALGAAVAAKDGYTSHHVDRVSRLAVAIGEQMRLPSNTLEILRWGGRLHDLGKIGVPNSILLKPGRLTDSEFRLMQQHSARGWQVARKSGVLEKAAAAIRGHHERWNGSGYPDGLAGENIPLEARIIAVADVWDAVTTDRPYRTGMSFDEAATLIRDGSGNLFDPRCVEALFAVLGDTRIEAAPAG
jgi:HD-GYP domain-containing protein (c-di-GMP phosphodiesterase class II)